MLARLEPERQSTTSDCVCQTIGLHSWEMHWGSTYLWNSPPPLLRLVRFPSAHAAEISACLAPGPGKVINIKYIIIVTLIPDSFVAMEFCEGANHARILSWSEPS